MKIDDYWGVKDDDFDFHPVDFYDTSRWLKQLRGTTIPGVKGTWRFAGIVDSSGIWYWFNDTLRLTVVATPFWQGEDQLPISISSFDGDDVECYHCYRPGPRSATEYLRRMKPVLKVLPQDAYELLHEDKWHLLQEKMRKNR